LILEFHAASLRDFVGGFVGGFVGRAAAGADAGTVAVAGALVAAEPWPPDLAFVLRPS
jgi:hypothetical protein